MDTTKTEITEMPDGMSSEELDALTTGEEEEKPETLAQEALDATKEESPSAGESVKDEAEETKVEPEPELSETEQQLRAKDSKIASMKHQHRDLELENARIKGELDARNSMRAKVEEPAKSPLEIAESAYIEENGELPTGGLPMTGELYRKQVEFDNAKAAAEVAVDKQEQDKSSLGIASEQLQAEDLSEESMGIGLDLQFVSNTYERYLTAGDLIDIKNIAAGQGMTAAVKEYYDKMIQRALNAKGQDAIAIQNAIAAKKATQKCESQTKPKKQTDIDALTTEGEDTDKGEAETGTHSQRLTNFVFAP